VFVVFVVFVEFVALVAFVESYLPTQLTQAVNVYARISRFNTNSYSGKGLQNSEVRDQKPEGINTCVTWLHAISSVVEGIASIASSDAHDLIDIGKHWSVPADGAKALRLVS